MKEDCKAEVFDLARWEAGGLTKDVIAAAIEVHRELGPGLLESAYRFCLRLELESRGLDVEWERDVPLRYRGIRLDSGYRLDLVVEGQVVVEAKAVQHLQPVHSAQLLTYLRLTGLEVGLLLNFNVALMKDGIRRVIRDARSGER